MAEGLPYEIVGRISDERYAAFAHLEDAVEYVDGSNRLAGVVLLLVRTDVEEETDG